MGQVNEIGFVDGESKMDSKAAMTLDDMIEDAVSIISKLRADNRFSKIIVLGHSEGSLIGMIADSLESLFSPANQPYIKSWLNYDPQSEIKQLTGTYYSGHN